MKKSSFKYQRGNQGNSEKCSEQKLVRLGKIGLASTQRKRMAITGRFEADIGPQWTWFGAIDVCIYIYIYNYMKYLKIIYTHIVLKAYVLSSCQDWGFSMDFGLHHHTRETVKRHIWVLTDFLKLSVLFKMMDFHWKEHGLMELGMSPKRVGFRNAQCR